MDCKNFREISSSITSTSISISFEKNRYYGIEIIDFVTVKKVRVMTAFRYFLIGIGGVFLFFTLTPLSAQENEFLICYEDQDMPPYIIGATEQSPNNALGILPEIVNEAVRNAGMVPKYVKFPWKRCLLLLGQNKVDGLFASIFQKDREKLGRYPTKDGAEDKARCLMKVGYAVFSSTKKTVPWNGTFYGKAIPSIAAPLGYVVVRTLQEKHGLKANTQLSPPMAMKFVAKGQLDGYIVEERIGKTVIEQSGLQGQVIPLSPIFEQHYWHFMISHRFYDENPDIAESVWDHIKMQREQMFPANLKEFPAKNS